MIYIYIKIVIFFFFLFTLRVLRKSCKIRKKKKKNILYRLCRCDSVVVNRICWTFVEPSSSNRFSIVVHLVYVSLAREIPSLCCCNGEFLPKFLAELFLLCIRTVAFGGEEFLACIWFLIKTKSLLLITSRYRVKHRHTRDYNKNSSDDHLQLISEIGIGFGDFEFFEEHFIILLLCKTFAVRYEQVSFIYVLCLGLLRYSNGEDVIPITLTILMQRGVFTYIDNVPDL